MTQHRTDGALWARWALDPELGFVEGLSIEWRNDRFCRVEPAANPPADLPPEARFDRLLTPGLLNAHSHLDYSFLKGSMPRGLGFAPWVSEIIGRSHRTDPTQLSDACADAVAQLATEGITEVWDISSLGVVWPFLAVSGLHAIVFEEWKAPRRSDWEARRDQFIEQYASILTRPPRRDVVRVSHGLAPHATYSVCPPALSISGDWARDVGLPLAIHLAESPEERELLVEGRGPLLDVLRTLDGWDPIADLGVGRSAIVRADAARVLGPATLAIHCNLPEPDEARLLAERTVVVVYCPRSHAYFNYPPYPLKAYRKAGVRLALGTDSMASNDALSIRAETSMLAEQAPDWSPLNLLACATGAMLSEDPPFGGRGRFQRGASAQWALWELQNPPALKDPESWVRAWLDPATRCAASSATSGIDHQG